MRTVSMCITDMTAAAASDYLTRPPSFIYSQISAGGDMAKMSGLTLQQAAVANDLIATWRLHVASGQASRVLFCKGVQPAGQ